MGDRSGLPSVARCRSPLLLGAPPQDMIFHLVEDAVQRDYNPHNHQNPYQDACVGKTPSDTFRKAAKKPK